MSSIFHLCYRLTVIPIRETATWRIASFEPSWSQICQGVSSVIELFKNLVLSCTDGFESIGLSSITRAWICSCTKCGRSVGIADVVACNKFWRSSDRSNCRFCSVWPTICHNFYTRHLEVVWTTVWTPLCELWTLLSDYILTCWEIWFP